MTKLHENVKINEDICGHFIIKDENGNIIISKKNTITDTGREFIFATFLKALGLLDDTITTDYSGYTFKQFNFYLDNKMTTPNMTFDNLSPNDLAISNIIDTNNAITLNKNSNNDLAIQFNASIISSSTSEDNSGGNGIHFNSIGLIIGDSDTDALFSRVVIDDVYIKPNVTYSLQYTIYF